MSISLKSNAWDQQRGESMAAFAAFRAYLEMGPERSMVAAYRKHNERPAAINVPGSWNSWARQFGWVERARQWDGQIAAKAQAAVLRRALSRVERLAEIYDGAVEKTLKIGQELIDQAARWASLPTTETTIESQENGKPVVYKVEPTNPKTHRYAGIIAAQGLALIQRAYERTATQALDRDSTEADPTDMAAVRDQAARDLDQWRAQQREAILAFPTEPPGDPAEPDEPVPAES